MNGPLSLIGKQDNMTEIQNNSRQALQSRGNSHVSPSPYYKNNPTSKTNLFGPNVGGGGQQHMQQD